MIAVYDRHSDPVIDDGSPVGIVCGGGSLPLAIADAATRAGRRVVLFALRGSVDSERIGAYRVHWIRVGEVGRLCRLAREEGCQDLVFIGGVVRPTVSQLWPDFGTWRLLPRVLRMFRGGDGHLLSGVAAIFEERGFRVVGAHEIAPHTLMPEGVLGGREPSQGDRSDVALGLAFLRATGPFDVGQAVVVADNRILAVEAAEGTDNMLARLAELRRSGGIQVAQGRGVLVKAPKPGQDRRLDLPSIGPRTIDGAARSGLAGIAVVAGSTIVAEPERITRLADRERLFVLGVRDKMIEQ